MENSDKVLIYVNDKLITKCKGRCCAEVLASKPNLHSRSISIEDIVAVKFKKLKKKEVWTVDFFSSWIKKEARGTRNKSDNIYR